MSWNFTYKEHLFNKKWIAKRTEILQRDNHRCVVCGSTEKLTVHHKQYHMTPDGRKYLPWMYENRYLVTLCEKCHMKGHRQLKVPVVVVPLPEKSVFDY